MASTNAWRVRAPAFLTMFFIFENASSIGLRSGEYEGRNKSSAPLASMSSLTFSVLCAPSPSSTTTCPSLRVGARKCSISLEDLRICGSLDGHRLAHRYFEGHRSDESSVLTPVSGNLAVSPLSSGCPCVQTRHGGVKPALVDEHQASGVEVGSQPAPQPPHLLVALLGYLRLFLIGQPPGRRLMARPTVALETLTPLCASSNASRCSSRVRSGFSSRCEAASHPSSAAPFTEGRPGIGLGSRSPVSRRLLSQRLMVGTDTEKVFATSSLGTPLSTAASTLSLRSLEYGFMPRG